ncbi:MAG: hypothetical protein AB7P49_21635 [Bdellovibrionales bacterium]
MIPRIDNFCDLEKLCNQECGVIFIWVNWSMFARNSAKIVERLNCCWNQQHPSKKIEFLQIDLSDQFGDMWENVRKWLESQNITHSGELMFGGVGSIVFVQSGTILHYVINPNSETVGGLLKMMTQVFGD